MQIYLARNNQQAGPYTLDQVNQMLADGQVHLADLAWHEGMTEWKKLGELTGGHMVYQPQQQTNTSQPSPTPQQTGWDNPNGLNTPIKKIDIVKKNNHDNNHLAPIGKRIAAKIIDLMLWLPVSIIPMFFLSEEATQKIQSYNNDFAKIAENQAEIFALLPEASLWAVGIYVVGMLMLQALLLAKSGQTIGKKALNLRIVDEDTGMVTNITRSLLLRSIVFIMAYNFIFIIFFIDFAMLYSQRNRTLHDRLARTVVVTATEQQTAQKPE